MTFPLARAMALFGFWVTLAGFGIAEVLVGMVAAGIAAWVSLRLLPSGHWKVRPFALAQLVLRFLRQSVAAGIDVAWRALDPRLPLSPGFVVYRPRLPQGAARSAYCTITSLLPGTLPCGPQTSGSLAVHCLDVSQPVTAQLSAEEAMLIEALGGQHSHD